jgi:arsenite methyltransferase
MATSLEEVLDRAFGHPRCLLGRLAGAVMERGNGPTESKVVEVAKPGPQETVLVLGPGPGSGSTSPPPGREG